MRSLYLFIAIVFTVAFIITLNVWLLPIIMLMFALAGFDVWLEQIQGRVMRELSKTCNCPLCKAARNERNE